MTVAMAQGSDVRIAYEVLGPPDGEPLALIMGLGLQMLFWPDDFCSLLIDEGFQVVRLDNRDTGLSTHFTQSGTPSPLAVLRGRGAPYRIDDMADDVVAVLDAVGWERAHIVGVSLGGMIAQTLAFRHAPRVRSLTSVMSTPAPSIGRPHPRVLPVLLNRPARDRPQAIRHLIGVFRAIGSPGYPHDEAWLADVAGRSFDRAHDPAGVRRQLAAILASGDRRPGLASVRVPTAVLHGAADPLVRPAGGRATAAAVRGASLETFPGMGHDLPRELWPAIVRRIRTVAAAAR